MEYVQPMSRTDGKHLLPSECARQHHPESNGLDEDSCHQHYWCDLQDIMKAIFKACKDAATEYNTTIQGGANIAGCLKVAEAMIAQGLY